MDNRDILEKYFIDNNITTIWGAMYGGHGGIGECIIKIPKKELTLSRNADAFIYIWGMPGPDGNIYEFSDYGVTWAFTREELAQYQTYEEKQERFNKIKTL